MPLITLQSAKGYGFGSLAGGSEITSFESIASTVLGSNTSSVTFSSIPSTYQHLQFRIDLRDTGPSASGMYYDMTFNNDTSSGYSYMYGETGTPPSSTNWSAGGADSFNVAYSPYFATSTMRSSVFAPSILDIFDYANTNKAKTFNNVGAFIADSTARFSNMAGHWRNNNAINTINFSHVNAQFAAGSTFSLYGIKNS